MTKENIVTRHAAERVLAEAADTTEERLAAFFECPQDPETMHKLRVAIRTQRSLLAFVEPFMKGKGCRQAQLALRNVVRETSRLREYDVLYAQLAALEPPVAQDLLAAVACAGEAERARVLDVLGEKKSRKRLAGARAISRNLPWRGAFAREGLAAAAVQQRFDELLVAQDARYGRLDRTNPEKTHNVRKKAKAVRYAATKFAMLLAEDAPDVAARMEAVQDELGALCDARVNVEIIDAFPRKKLSVAARSDLARLKAINEAHIATATHA